SPHHCTVATLPQTFVHELQSKCSLLLGKMKKYLIVKRFPWPWLKGKTEQGETSPLLPKVGRFMSLGFVLTMLCLSGCVGALRENCFLLKLFSFAVLTLIAVQVLLGILAYSMQGQIGGYLRSGMLAAMVRYQDDLDLRFITDEIQTNLQCCGADNYRDWEVNIYYNCSAPGVLACGVPATCCVDPLENGTVWNSQCGVGALMLDEFSAQSVIFLGGCLGGISRWIELHQTQIGIVSIVVVGVQILTLFVSTRLLERMDLIGCH
uniref:Tetraspanin-10 n=1 Tax=Gouania willdenowi TaxID=441366 RepID=A0A8C5DPY3_GOUWI